MTQSKRDEGETGGPRRGSRRLCPSWTTWTAPQAGRLDGDGALEWAPSFLATTGSTTPFIGLFGTVWGSWTLPEHRRLGRGGLSRHRSPRNLRGARGHGGRSLAAAIPAVIFYNLFTHRVGLFTTEMEALSAEVLNIVGRNAAERVTASTENRI